MWFILSEGGVSKHSEKMLDLFLSSLVAFRDVV